MAQLSYVNTINTSMPDMPYLPTHPSMIRHLVLGDSYATGQDIAVTESWPAQLQRMLLERGLPAVFPTIIARTGWTAADLAESLRDKPPAGRFELVSLLIGFNNQYMGCPLEEYRHDFRRLLQTALGLAVGPGRIIVLSIPDWGATPFASGRDRAAITQAVDAFNAVNRSECLGWRMRYVDVTTPSRRALDDPALTADDGLHPSAGHFEEWAALVLPEAMDALGVLSGSPQPGPR